MNDIITSLVSGFELLEVTLSTKNQIVEIGYHIIGLSAADNSFNLITANQVYECFAKRPIYNVHYCYLHSSYLRSFRILKIILITFFSSYCASSLCEVDRQL